MKKLVSSSIVVLLVCLVNVQGRVAYSRYVETSRLTSVKQPYRLPPFVTKANLFTSIREATECLKLLLKVDTTDPRSATIVNILLHAACQHLRDQGVNPLPDYCYTGKRTSTATPRRNTQITISSAMFALPRQLQRNFI